MTLPFSEEFLKALAPRLCSKCQDEYFKVLVEVYNARNDTKGGK